MKVFLTGGAGFIGAFVAKKLIEEGDLVIIYDAFMNFVSPLTSHYGDYIKFRLEEIKDKANSI